MPDSNTHRSVLYRLLAFGFLYPDAEVKQLLLSPTFSEALGERVSALGNPSISAQVAALKQAVVTTRAARLDLAAEHVALFSRNVPCSPYGSRYLIHDVMARPRILEEVSGIYRAFGLEVSREHPDLPDHIGTQLEFLGYLIAKELRALETGREEQAAICRDARAWLLQEHLLLWVPAFQQRLREHARLPFYPAVVDLVLAVLRDDARAIGCAAGQLHRHNGSESLASDTLVRERVPVSAQANLESDDDESTFDCSVFTG